MEICDTYAVICNHIYFFWKLPHDISLKPFPSHLLELEHLNFSMIFCTHKLPNCCAAEGRNYNIFFDITLCMSRSKIKKSFQIYQSTISLPNTSEMKPKCQLCLTYLTRDSQPLSPAYWKIVFPSVLFSN